MSYGTPVNSSQPSYQGSFYAYATDESMYGATIRLSFQMTVEDVAQAAPDREGFLDPNFQSFLDYVADWPGFALPTGSEYTILGPTELSAAKTRQVSQEATPTA